MFSASIYGHDENLADVPQNIDFVIQKLNFLGYKVHGSCRFMEFKRRFMKFQNQLKKNDISIERIELRKILEGYKDYREVSIISSCKEVMLNARREVQFILGGNVLPEDDKNKVARDFQYQMYLTSLFILSGFPVRIEEPDFSFVFKGKKYVVAAKRLDGKGSIEDNLRYAEKQISQHNHYGFIAVSFDRLYQEREMTLEVTNPDNSIRVCHDLINTVIKDDFKTRYFSGRSSQILGVIASISLPFLMKGTPELGYACFTSFLPINDTDTSEWNEVISIINQFNKR